MPAIGGGGSAALKCKKRPLECTAGLRGPRALLPRPLGSCSESGTDCWPNGNVPAGGNAAGGIATGDHEAGGRGVRADALACVPGGITGDWDAGRAAAVKLGLAAGLNADGCGAAAAGAAGATDAAREPAAESAAAADAIMTARRADDWTSSMPGFAVAVLAPPDCKNTQSNP